MDERTIGSLLAPFLSAPLNEKQFGQVKDYLGLLMKWNAKMNLTAVRKPEEVIARHFGESFFVAERLLDDSVRDVIDLGSGAGFPGLPIAIHSPIIKVTLIESQNKKATFLKEVVRAVGFANARVFAGRGEDYSGKADLVTFRAVERFEAALEVAKDLAKPTGRLGLLIGAGQQKDLPTDFSWDLSNKLPGVSSRVLAIGVRNQEPEK